MTEFSSGICNELQRSIPRQPDGEIFYIHFTGGFRAGKVDSNRWVIEPVFEGDAAQTKGYLSDAQLRKIVRIGGFRALGFQSSGWSKGEWHSSWRPIVPSEESHLLGPADLWSNISNNLFQATRAQRLRESKELDHASLSTILDDQTLEERLAQAISLSLRSMDLAVEAIAEHYHEQLVNRMYAGQVEGQRSSNTMNQNLFANIHAFFLQLGSARDYLAAFVASRLGMDSGHGKVDTMNALKGKLRAQHSGGDKILDQLTAKGFLLPQDGNPDRWEIAGWLKDITDLRNEIVHRRPYGSVHAERFGYAMPLRPDLGLYRYFRPIQLKDQSEHDLLDLICTHYRTCAGLFFDAANLSGLDANMMTFTDKDIVSLKVRHP